MAPLSTTGRNLILDALGEANSGGAKYISLHTAYSATGTNELTGGSPAYARKALVWNAAGSGAKALSADVTLDVPAGAVVAYQGFWDAITSGNFLGMSPNGSATAKLFVLDDTTADTFKVTAHGFSAADPVAFFGSMPTGITEGTVYYVIAASLTTNAFQVSATVGGSAVAITGAGAGTVQKCVVETFASQGQFTVKAASTSFDGTVI